MSGENNISPLPLGEGPGVRAAGNHRRANPYVQVALTYIRRPFSSGIGRFWIVLILILFGTGLFENIFSRHQVQISNTTLLTPEVFNQLKESSPPEHNLISFMNGLLFISIFAVMHLRDLFANTSNHLLPQYRRAYATIAFAAVLFLVVILPLIISWATGIHSLVLIAFTTFFLGVFLMSASLQSGLMLIFGLAGYWVVMMLSLKDEWQMVYAERYDTHLYCALAGGVAMILFGGIRFIWPSEKLLESQKAFQWDLSGRTQMTGQRPLAEFTLFRRLYYFLADRQMIVTTRHATRAAVSLRSRLERREFGIGKGWLSLFVALSQVLFILVMLWITTNPPKSFVPEISLKLSYIFLLALPSVALMLWCHQRISILAYELSLPVRRKEYFQQLGAAAALSHFKLTAGCVIGYALLWLVVSAGTFSLPRLILLTLTFAAWQVFVYGVIVLCARYPILANTIVILLLMALFFSIENPSDVEDVTGRALTALFYTTMLFGTLGLPMIYVAYRRWLVADVD